MYTVKIIYGHLSCIHSMITAVKNVLVMHKKILSSCDSNLHTLFYMNDVGSHYEINTPYITKVMADAVTVHHIPYILPI